MKFYIAGIGHFAYFFANNSGNIAIFNSYRKIDADDAETHFWLVIDCSVLCAYGVTRRQGVVLRRIGGHGHFRSRDKDDDHTVRSAITENPLLYANCTALSSIELELLPIEV